ncbi:GNAT family N-acetyltransferase [Halostella sp. JP-L12]|uniref:GNAT family N-acetyltransferase n=1 Tax=Halostella TaxID=1843185 RepID=UPI000EF78103|nr:MULTISPECIES: GNAT family N-acetyltransferase [Halostella]NHN48544.1 GNAT family N-acetyltransferase [Halostella sp. JP-L12]
MQAQQRLQFDSEDRKRLYEHVERNGAVERDELDEAFGMDRDRIDEELSALEADGYLEERDGIYRIAVDLGEELTYEADGVEVTIRPAEQSDLTGLVGVMREVAEEDAYLTAETVVDLLDHEEVVFRNNDVESRTFFVATVAGDVVGWVHLQSPNFEKLQHTAELTIGVLDEYRGHGIGSHLMERGLEWAESSGYEKVYQSLPATNQEAVRFLEQHRWETEAIRRAHYKIDDEYVAEQQMAVMLSQPELV